MDDVKTGLAQQAREYLKEHGLIFNDSFRETGDGDEIKFAGLPGDNRPLCWLKCCYKQNENNNLGLCITFDAFHDSYEHGRKHHIFWSDSCTESDAPSVKQDFSLAQLRFEHASNIGSSKYLSRKKCDDCHGIKYEEIGDKTTILIPVRDVFCNLIAIEEINEDGIKKTLGPKSKGFFTFGELKDGKNVYLTEGFSTGCSVYESTEETTLCCFGAGGLLSVGKAIRSKYPKSKIYIAGDSDVPGMESADKASKALGCTVFYPPDKDFNDTFCKVGAEKTADYLKPKSYKPISLENFLKKDIPPVEWLIPDLLPKKGVNAVVGGPGIGKSWFTYELAYCLATGCSFLNYPPMKPMRCLYIDGEMDDSQVMERVVQIAERVSKKPSNFNLITKDDLLDTNQQGINLYSPLCRDMLSDCIEEVDVIFLDNFSNLTWSEKEGYENTAESWRPIGEFIKEWAYRGKTFILVHHTNKLGGSRGTSRMNVDFRVELLLSKYAGPSVPDIDTTLLAFKVEFIKGRGLSYKGQSDFNCRLHKMSGEPEWSVERKPEYFATKEFWVNHYRSLGWTIDEILKELKISKREYLGLIATENSEK